MITQEQLKELFHYDADTGVFTRIDNRPVSAALHEGYLRLTINRNTYLQHRLAWLYVYGSFPINHIDHINGTKHDNRICNLRDVTQRENCQNRKEHREGRLVGSSYNSKQNNWRACIGIGKKVHHIGFFATEAESSSAYFKALENPDLFLQQKPEHKVTNIHFCNTHKYFIARKMVNKVSKCIGYFKTEAEALAAVARFNEANKC